MYHVSDDVKGAAPKKFSAPRVARNSCSCPLIGHSLRIQPWSDFGLDPPLLSTGFPVAIYTALICLKEHFHRAKGTCIINVLETYSQHRASYSKISERREHFLPSIPFSPHDTIFTCRFSKIKCGRKLVKDFETLYDPIQGLTKTIPINKCSKRSISMRKGL